MDLGLARAFAMSHQHCVALQIGKALRRVVILIELGVQGLFVILQIRGRPYKETGWAGGEYWGGY
jgi:hypothetical protein